MTLVCSKAVSIGPRGANLVSEAGADEALSALVRGLLLKVVMKAWSVEITLCVQRIIILWDREQLLARVSHATSNSS